MILAGSFLVTSSAIAEIRFNGFASIYAGMTFDDDESLYGYNDDIEFKPETLFGLQAMADLGDGLTATAQLIARGEDDFDAEFEWAYFTYSVNDNFDVSVGRLRIPFFKYSEYLDVGYAYPWARTPRDVYDVDFNTMEGARFNYNHSVGMWDLSWQAVYGSLQTDLSIGGNLLSSEAEKITGLSLDGTRDWFSFRLGYTIAELTFQAGLEPLAPLFANPADFDAVQPKEDDGYFASAGVFIDYEDWLINAEVVQYEAEDNLSVKTDAFYLMFGKRLGEFTLAYTYSENDESNEFDAVNSIPQVIPNPNPGTELICGATAREFVRNCVINQENENNTHSVTLRWNFHAAAALTFDYTNRERDVTNGRSVDESDKLFTVGVDLVF